MTTPVAVPLGPGGERLVVIGELVGTHGIRGEARLRPFNRESEILGDVDHVFLLRGEAPARSCRVESARPHGGVWLVVLEGVTTMEAVRAMVGTRVAVRERDLPALDDAQFYCYQLVGLAVVDEEGRGIGKVAEVLSTGANDVLVVIGERGEHLIPMIDRAIAAIDLAAGSIVVRRTEGLFE